MNEINELAAALAKAQGQMSGAAKDGRNPHLKNSYMTLTAVWDAIRKPLADNGLSVAQMTNVTEAGDMILTTRLMHASGQYIESQYPIVAGTGNRGVNSAQATGSALTYARRYSLATLIGVVADEDDDGNEAPTHRKPARKPTSSNNDSAPRWKSPQAAQEWAWAQTDEQGRKLFGHMTHVVNGYNKVKAEANPKSAAEMWDAWSNYVEMKRAGKDDSPIFPDDQPTNAELDAIAAAEEAKNKPKF